MAEGEVTVLRDALAEYFDVDPEEIIGLIVGYERPDGGFSSAWAAASPFQVLGYIDEFREQQKLQRAALGHSENGKAT